MQKNMRGKAEMSIQFLFLIFIGTIVAFVVLGMITKWSFSADMFIKTLTGDGGKTRIRDIEKINLTRCDDSINEIVKHAKLCYAKAREGLVDGDLCYMIKMPASRCSPDVRIISDTLTKAMINNTVNINNPVDKVVVSYDYKYKRVNVE